MLPDVLTVWAIACLWAGDDHPDLVLPLADSLVEAVIKNDLKAQESAHAQEPVNHDPFSIALPELPVFAELDPCPDDPPSSNDGYQMSVQRNDFVVFLATKGLGVPQFWLGEPKQSKAGQAAHAADFEARAFARKIAETTWSGSEAENSTPERIGALAIYIEKQLVADKYGHYTDRTIKGWIADLAPKGARRSGRPPKTS